MPATNRPARNPAPAFLPGGLKRKRRERDVGERRTGFRRPPGSRWREPRRGGRPRSAPSVKLELNLGEAPRRAEAHFACHGSKADAVARPVVDGSGTPDEPKIHGGGREASDLVEVDAQLPFVVQAACSDRRPRTRLCCRCEATRHSSSLLTLRRRRCEAPMISLADRLRRSRFCVRFQTIQSKDLMRVLGFFYGGHTPRAAVSSERAHALWLPRGESVPRREP
jgi:hypothetical protein